ncbi:hypothetical protein DERP_002203, partial [Dermatophagoides pteronyssinus]
MSNESGVRKDDDDIHQSFRHQRKIRFDSNCNEKLGSTITTTNKQTTEKKTVNKAVTLTVETTAHSNASIQIVVNKMEFKFRQTSWRLSNTGIYVVDVTRALFNIDSVVEAKTTEIYLPVFKTFFFKTPFFSKTRGICASLNVFDERQILEL